MPPKLHHLHPKSLVATSAVRAIPTQVHPASGLPTATSVIAQAAHRHPSSTNNVRPFSSLNRPPPLYPQHVPITSIERTFLAISSTLYSFFSPRRPDLIALCSETTTPLFLLRSLRDRMLSSPSGRQILRERPRISSQTVDLDYLRTLPETTFGKIYVTWLDREHVTPDTRDPVRHIPDPELAYVLQRYRESHDLFHVLLAEKGMPSFLEGEVVVKAFEFAALGLPMTGLAALSAVKLPKEQRRRVLWGGRGGAGDTYEDVGNKDGSNNSEGEEIQASRSSGGAKGGEPWITWAISQGLNTNTSPSGGLLNMYWEKEWETPILELRERLGTRLPEGVGDLRVIRRREREERKRREMAGQ